jgi:monovalent cation:H+ antiporter-2, CPA2 family
MQHRARHSQYLIIAIPEAFEAGQIVEQAYVANPDIQIITRAHSDVEVGHLKSLGADTVIMGEREIAQGILEDLVAHRAEEYKRP